jgi:hypothetical protein
MTFRSRGTHLAATPEEVDLRKRKEPGASSRNAQTTAGQQESRDGGSVEQPSGDSGIPIPAQDPKGRQAYDRSGKGSRDFKRAGQTHADVQDRTG